MYAERHIVDVTTDGSGAATAFTPEITGAILSVVYVKDGGANPFTNGVDFAITLEATGQNIWTEADVNASKTVHPVTAAAVAAGSASALSEVRHVAAKDRVKIVIAQGGATKVGRFHVVVG
jgi:hypothetical protein